MTLNCLLMSNSYYHRSSFLSHLRSQPIPMIHQGIILSNIKIAIPTLLVPTNYSSTRAPPIILRATYLAPLDWSTHMCVSAVGRSVLGTARSTAPPEAPLLTSMTAASFQTSHRIFLRLRSLAQAVFAVRRQ